jgi:hypothetical protein
MFLHGFGVYSKFLFRRGKRPIMAPCIHGHVGAFYARRAREGNQILQIKSGSWPLVVRRARGAGARGCPHEHVTVSHATNATLFDRAERLDLGHAAVDEEFDAGDVAAVVGGQEHGRPGDLVGGRQAPERDRADEGSGQNRAFLYAKGSIAEQRQVS